jgi:hypothetical protein
MTETLRRIDVATSQLLQTLPSEDTLIDALRGCRRTEELEALEQRLRGVSEAPPLFEWICDLLVARRISRGLAARLLTQLHSQQQPST